MSFLPLFFFFLKFSSTCRHDHKVTHLKSSGLFIFSSVFGSRETSSSHLIMWRTMDVIQEDQEQDAEHEPIEPPAWTFHYTMRGSREFAALLAGDPKVINAVDDEGHTPLHLAANGGDHEIVAQLLACGSDVNAVCAKNWTVLHYAARGGWDKVVSQLLVYNDLILAVDVTNRTALHMAAESGHDKVVAQLLAHRPDRASATDHKGWSALHFAAKSGDSKVMERLIAQCPQLLNVDCQKGWTALHIAAKFGHRNIVSQLLAHSPSLGKVACSRRYLPLHLAAEEGHETIVAELIALNPATVLSQSDKGWTALQLAAKNGHEKVVDKLLPLSPEAVYSWTDPHRDTLLHHAIKLRWETPPFSKEIITHIWRKNMEAVRTRNLFGQTPFHLCAEDGNPWAIELLQPKLCWDEIIASFKDLRKKPPFDRLRRVLDEQCLCLSLALTQDVVSIVFTYLGFGIPKRASKLV